MFGTHRCELTRRSDFIISKPKGELAPIKSLLRSWSTISENHPKCQKYLISFAVANKEKIRHESHKQWWIVHPFSKMRLFWEMVMVVLYFFQFTLIPFMMCFVIIEHQTRNFFVLNLIMSIFSWIDILGNCITGYYDREKDEFVMDQVTILKRYSKRYMLVDITSTIVYDYLTLWSTLSPSGPLVYINMIPLLRLSRYFTFRLYIQQFFQNYGEDISCHMFLTLLLYTFIVHWFTCLCNITPRIMRYKIYNEVISQESETWLLSLRFKGIAQRYQRALFIVLENFTASGYGGLQPQTEGHIAVCTILMVLGRLFESYIIVMLLQIVAERKASASKYEQIVNQLSAFVRQKQLPPYMKQRLLAYYHYRFRDSYFRENKILSNLSASLREEVILHSCRRLVENVEIFQDLPKHTLTQIVANLKPELYLAKDMIIKAGMQGDCMFFLSSGTVAILTPTGKEVCFLEDGAHFGEVALLVQDQRRVASVVAVEVCEVYRLDRKDFRKCIAVHSDLFSKIERIATERMLRTSHIEEQHKRFWLHAKALKKEFDINTLK
ncbi:potassium/sodium hyperpolarization-activated cyclic nucleotide-gated channel 1-like [Copidosoma floridanum]|uniref:potassium/sodium hyperpolarization-activated cyclic nucleotide-gated channel 1-like n=1 Tax=Copidosoma floridanum TaxID=29053 RepID=UPI0006C9D8EC|nr:potassium/sodium hyperpolarization-activated cyclic nucleotide-gated channel 1-like [Copidosoma floridanum]